MIKEIDEELYYSSGDAVRYLKDELHYPIKRHLFDKYAREGIIHPSKNTGSSTRFYSKSTLNQIAKKGINIFSHAKILTFANHKGGVGKTASVFNISSALTKFHHAKVLVVDIDPQANLTMSYGIDTYDNNINTIDDVLIHKTHSLNDIKIKINNQLDLIPSHTNLCLADIQSDLVTHDTLKDELELIKNQYDFIVIDCPPQFTNLTIMSVKAGEFLFIPLKPDLYSVNGLNSFLEFANQANANIHIAGIFITFFSKRQTKDKVFYNALNTNYKEYMLDSHIRGNVTIAECVMNYQNVFDYDSHSHGANDYRKLTKEIFAKLTSGE